MPDAVQPPPAGPGMPCCAAWRVEPRVPASDPNEGWGLRRLDYSGCQRPAPYERPQARGQQAGVDRLDQVVIRAGIQGAGDAARCAEGREDQDRHVGEGSNALAHLPAVHPGISRSRMITSGGLSAQERMPSSPVQTERIWISCPRSKVRSIMDSSTSSSISRTSIAIHSSVLRPHYPAEAREATLQAPFNGTPLPGRLSEAIVAGIAWLTETRTMPDAVQPPPAGPGMPCPQCATPLPQGRPHLPELRGRSVADRPAGGTRLPGGDTPGGCRSRQPRKRSFPASVST